MNKKIVNILLVFLVIVTAILPGTKIIKAEDIISGSIDEDTQATVNVERVDESELDNLDDHFSAFLKEENKQGSELLALKITAENYKNSESYPLSLTINDENVLTLLKKNYNGRLFHYDYVNGRWIELKYSLNDNVMSFNTPNFGIFAFGNVIDLDVKDDDIEVKNFEVHFKSGAKQQGDKLVWTPSDSSKRNEFIYKLSYEIAGEGELAPKEFKIELPLHIIRDRNGGYGDSFDCPFLEASQLDPQEDPDFVYEIDEQNNKVIIYNHRTMDASNSGYIDFDYVTTESTFEYKDMQESEIPSFKLIVKSQEAQAQAERVCIDTNVKLESITKETSNGYRSWNEDWGDKPADSDSRYYQEWNVTTRVYNHTQGYTITLNDAFSDFAGEVVGYKLSGETTYSDKATSGERRGNSYTDKVLVSYDKETIDKKYDAYESIVVHNTATATLKPIDELDPSSTLTTSASYNGSKKKPSGPPKYYYEWPIEHYYTNKYGNKIYYDLDEFLSGKKESIDNIYYDARLNAYAYPHTLEEGAYGDYDDALAGKYGQRNVDYEFSDDNLILNGVALNPEDYDFTSFSIGATMYAGEFNQEKKYFYQQTIPSFSKEDNITVWAKVDGNSDEWIQIATYDMTSKELIDLDDNYIDGDDYGDYKLSNVKGLRLTFSNKYFDNYMSLGIRLSLNRTDHVLDILKDASNAILTNTVNSSFANEGNVYFRQSSQANNTIKKVIRNSSLNKQVIKVVNNKHKSNFTITYRSTVNETYIDNYGTHYIPQDGGTFYELLPSGVVYVPSSLKVQANQGSLNEGQYDTQVIENYQGSGREMVVVKIKEKTNDIYTLIYDTTYLYNDVADYGRNLLSSVAYQTGNEKLTHGRGDDGGEITDKELLEDLDPNNDDDRFLYKENRNEIVALLYGNIGLLKQVKGQDDVSFAYSATVKQNQEYSYRIRLKNNNITKSKHIIFFDSLDNFYKEQTNNKLISAWHGTLEDVDISQLEAKGIKPVVYLSKLELDINDHHDLTEKIDGENVWIEYKRFKKTYGLSAARAIAIDASKGNDGEDFVLESEESLVFNLYMRAPSGNPSEYLAPIAYNNIYAEYIAIDKYDKQIDYFQHHDYTKTTLMISSDVLLKKVDTNNHQATLANVTYMLRGTSIYGTVYNEKRTTAYDGKVEFHDIEQGTYELNEIDCPSDWLKDDHVYTITIDGMGKAYKDGEPIDQNNNLLLDEPRIHTDIALVKKDLLTNEPLNGTEFFLVGTSEYGREINEHVVSSGENQGVDLGMVLFNDIELGSYKLVEVKTDNDHILNETVWKVIVDDQGVGKILDEKDSELSKDANDIYQVFNEPLHQIRFVKTSSYGVNNFLEGAEFILSGVSDSGKYIKKESVSGSDGMVIFNDLESGMYYLQEKIAPQGHERSEDLYVVKVKQDGTFFISDMDTTTIGGQEIFNCVNEKTKGVYKVTKIWQDDLTNEERPNIDISISTILPSKDPRGYKIIFDANGGTFPDGSTTNEMIYSSNGNIVSGQYKVPQSSEPLTGWNTKEGVDFEFDNNHNLISQPADVTLYADYVKPIKYAVSIYDIGVDDVRLDDGTITKGGLTFGNALGGNYLYTYKSHTPTGITTSGNNKRCVHDDDWATIVQWSETDPYVYEDCVRKGCTHSVELRKNTTTTILNTSLNNKSITGDGVGGLYDELKPNRVVENLRPNPVDRTYGTNTGGYPRTRIRAMLNGADSYTNISSNRASGQHEYDPNPSASIYTKTNCLFATFPSALRNGIASRVVKSATSTGYYAYVMETYDKLWIPSISEIRRSPNRSYLDKASGTFYKRCDMDAAKSNHRFTNRPKDSNRDYGANYDGYTNALTRTINGDWIIVETDGGVGITHYSCFAHTVIPFFTLKGPNN